MHAVVMAGVLNLVGALCGTAVAETIAEGIVDPDVVDARHGRGRGAGAPRSGHSAAQYFGLPSSESHALVAGLIGAGSPRAASNALE